MALDPSIILRASDAFNRLPNYGEVMAQRAAIQGQQQANAERMAALAQQQQDRTKANARETSRVSLGQMAAGGDYAGARRGALQTGDFDIVSKLDAMGDEGRKRAFDISQHTAPLLMSLKNVPPEQRGAALQQIAPQLLAAGFKPDDIAKVGTDLSDGALDRHGTSAMTIAEYQSANKPVSLGSYDKLVNPQTGATIAEGMQPTKFMLDPETGKVIQVGGPGTTTAGTNPNSADVVFGNGKYGAPSTQLSSLAMGGVQDFQRNTLIPATRGKVGAGPTKGSGAVGTYQITYGTLNTYAPKLFGPNWEQVAFSAENQDRLGEAIYNDAQGGDLHDVWAGMPRNAPGAYSNVPWEQVKGKIAQVESGGSAPAPARNGNLSAGYRWADNTRTAQEPIPGGAADKGAQLPKVPTAVMKDYITNRSAVRLFDEADSAVSSYSGAVGSWNYLTPDFLAQRTDPKGVNVRSLITNIGSQIIHDRSGAAVTVSEYPRLKPFIPLITDTPATIHKKLSNLKRILTEMNADMVDGYSNDSGDSQLDRVGSRDGGGAAPAMPSGFKVIRRVPPK